MPIKLFTFPNLITLGNLLCGCFGIVQVFQGNFEVVSYLIFTALLLDFLDGFIARLLNSSSLIGKELDSLADVVTFGVLPALIIYKYLIAINSVAYIAFLLAIFSALRLAKFNIDTRQTSSFIGLPTPANALFVASFPLILRYNPNYAAILLNPIFLISYTLIMSYLLIAELPLFALKFSDFSWAANKIKFIFLILSVILLLVLQFVAIPMIIILYVLLSVFNIFMINKPK